MLYPWAKLPHELLSGSFNGVCANLCSTSPEANPRGSQSSSASTVLERTVCCTVTKVYSGCILASLCYPTSLSAKAISIWLLYLLFYKSLACTDRTQGGSWECNLVRGSNMHRQSAILYFAPRIPLCSVHSCRIPVLVNTPSEIGFGFPRSGIQHPKGG